MERSDYRLGTLEESDLTGNPLEILKSWVESAAQHPEVIEPTAMALATVGADGRPSSRMVLLRDYRPNGVCFFTNYDSRKGVQIRENQFVAATLWWPQLERQLRLEGVVERLSVEDSDAYFAARPRESQLASASSPQSRAIPSREELEDHLLALGERYPNEVPRPSHWGGYLLVPDRIEFWQGRPARFHDRFFFEKGEGSGWTLTRLAP